MSVRDTLIGLLQVWTNVTGAAPETPEAVTDAYRAEVLNEEADRFEAACPDKGADFAFMRCHCDAATELRKRADRTN